MKLSTQLRHATGQPLPSNNRGWGQIKTGLDCQTDLVTPALVQAVEQIVNKKDALFYQNQRFYWF